jgi:hypothetical protein
MAEQYVAVDPVSVTLSSTGAYEEVDVDDYIASLPAGVTGVALRVINTHTSAMGYRYRKNGSTDDLSGAVTASAQVQAFVGLDASNIFEFYRVSTTISIYIVGYFIDVTFLTNLTDVSTATTGSWADLDSGQSSAIGLILLAHPTSTTSYDYGLRKNGSTDDRHNRAVRKQGDWIIGADAGVSEQYIENNTFDMYLIGYITANFTFNTNASDISLGSTGSYADLTAGAATAKANIVEVASSSYYDFALRRNGASDDIYYRVNRHTCIIVGADTSGVSEGKIANTGADFFLIGWANTVATGGVALAGAVITKSGLAASSSVLRALTGAVISKSGLLGATSVARYLAGAVITKSGLQGALGKQIQVAGQVVTSTTLAGALTLSQIIALAGQIITQTTLAGAASVSRALAGQVATVSTLAGVPSIARALAGQISTITAATSVPSCIRGIVGAVSTVSSLQGASSVAKGLSGAVATASGLSAVPGVLRGMAGEVITSSGLAGVPSVARGLVGPVITKSGATGTASALKALAGVVITSSGLTGALTVVGQGIVALSGAIVTVSSLAGSAAVQKALAGQIITEHALSSTASVIRGLIGQAITSSGLSGTPSVIRDLTGQVITASGLTGNGRVVIALSGVVSTVTGLQGALTIAYENIIELAGQVITATGITSALSTIRGLQGQVVTSSGLSGAASLSLALAGQVVTSVAADCSASVSIALAGAISTVTTITGHLIDVFQRVKKAARIDSLMTVYARIDSVVKRFGRF